MVTVNLDTSLPLHTLGGLREYLTRARTQVSTLGPQEYEQLTPTERIDYNRARSDFVTGGDLIVETPEMLESRAKVEELRQWNRVRTTDRWALMLSGEGVSGKTTALKVTMDDVYADVVSQYPEFRDGPWLPIVYVEVPSTASGKTLLQAFATALDLTYTQSEVSDSLMRRAVRDLRDAHTQYVVVDEAHNLTTANKAHAETADVMRQLQRTIMATFAYGGLPTADLMTSATSSQITGRTAYVELGRYRYQTITDQATWRGLVEGIEGQLPLHSHVQGTLVELDEHLYFLTDGALGTLNKLICGAANALILRGDPAQEMLTKELLDAQSLDMRAQASLGRKKQERARKTRKSDPNHGP